MGKLTTHPSPGRNATGSKKELTPTYHFTDFNSKRLNNIFPGLAQAYLIQQLNQKCRDMLVVDIATKHTSVFGEVLCERNLHFCAWQKGIIL